MAHRSHTQFMRQTRRVPQHSVGTKGGPASRAIPRPLGAARLGSRKRIKLVRSTRGPERPPLGSIHLTSPVALAVQYTRHAFCAQPDEAENVPPLSLQR